VTYFNREYKEVIGLFLILSHKVEMKSVNLAISFIKFEALQWSWKDLVSESSLYRCKVFHNRNKKKYYVVANSGDFYSPGGCKDQYNIVQSRVYFYLTWHSN
jgi:hypothetical protein